MDKALMRRTPTGTGSRRPEILAAAHVGCHQLTRHPAFQQHSSRCSDGQAQRDLLNVAARRPAVITHAAAAEAPAATNAPALSECRLDNLLNPQGYIDPEVPDGTEATVFAIFDKNKKLQYIGFSKDFRNSLRTVFGRRPDKVFYHKSTHLPKLDQAEMLVIRNAWYEEVGGPPIGNKLAMERAQWEKPVDGGAISQRGKLEAAKNQVLTQLAMMKTRGCVEEFAPNPELLEQGKVDFLPAKPLDREFMEREKERLAKIQKATRTCKAVVDDEPRDFNLFFQNSYKTNGGWMFDVMVTFDERETKHRVICGEEFYAPLNIEPETTIERVFAFLLEKKVPRHTEGMMLSNEFPINYFSVSEVEQSWPDFQRLFAEGQLPGDAGYWRFNRIHDYGAMQEDSSFNTVNDGSPKTWMHA